MSIQFKITKNLFKGGVYTLKTSSRDNVVVQKFFVLNFDNRKAGVISDWNIETIKPGDLLKGKITLKNFTKENNFQEVKAKYSFINGDGNILKELKDLIIFNNKFDIEYEVPNNINGILILSVTIEADGILVPYKKEFKEAIFEDIEI